MDRDLPQPEGDESRDDDRPDDLSPIGAGCLITAGVLALFAIVLGLWIGGQLVQWECEVINQGPMIELPMN